MTSVVQFQNVSVVRDGKVIIDDVNWTVDDDQRWVVIGPNGAGKTTLLMLASAYDHPTDGVVTILGEPLGEGDVFGSLRTALPSVGFKCDA